MERNDLLGGAYYINLDSRIDKRTHIEIELDKLGVKAKRYAGVFRTQRTLGRSISHLEVLKDAKALNLKNVLIFEDNFVLTVSRDRFWQSLTDFFNTTTDYKALMISYNLHNYKEFSPTLYEVISASNSSAYLVNSSAYDEMIRLYEHSIPMLEQTSDYEIYANDQIWVKLQARGKWYALKETQGNVKTRKLYDPKLR